MSFFSRFKDAFLEKRSNSLENAAVSLASPGAWAWLSGGDSTASGEIVNELVALQQTTVFAAVSLIAQSVASLPLITYEKTEKGKREATDSPLYSLLRYSPSPETNSQNFWEAFVGSVALNGNGYAEIQRDGAGDPIALWNLNASLTAPVRKNGLLAYETSDGMPNGEKRMISAANMLHVPYFTLDGILGLNPVSHNRQMLGLAAATTKFGARFFGSGARPGGVLSVETPLTDEQMASSRDSWQSAQGGANSGKVAILQGGWKYEPLSLSPDDSQFLQTQQYTREQIAALWHVPVHLLGDTSRLSNATASQQNLSFVTGCLRHFMQKIESAIQHKLLNSHGQASDIFCKFDVTELLRGDPAETNAALSTARQWGYMTANESRAVIGLDPVPEGNVLLYPLNMGNSIHLLKEPTEDEPTAASLGSLRTSFHRLFADGVRKTCHRQQRDLKAVTSNFRVLLEGIAECAVDSTRSKLDADLQHDSTKVIEAFLTKLTERSAKWTTEEADAITAAELDKAVRAFAYDAHKGATTHLIQKELNDQAS
ncbi:phage portal protein [Acidipila sp. EB88]|uniref:phage portal protein n=1 Tax=Acidipila sp. EB88 TaxID=2305226 RepID=UPI000F5E6C12|nr:phage portal protein [Acidipila sp. EB88]RRA48997.1 phage portal protein [Acidipila sp. EB88]